MLITQAQSQTMLHSLTPSNINATYHSTILDRIDRKFLVEH